MKIAIAYEESIITAIKKRKSIRTYQPVRIIPEKRKILQGDLDALGNDLYRFMWFERETRNILAERIRTYGVIKGANAFLIGIRCKEVENQKDTAINFGYDFEQVILKATELELGTCWIAGTYISTLFASLIDLCENEKITMISPVGIPGGKLHLLSKLFTRSAKSKTRKSLKELFFDGRIKTPLSEKNISDYALALEMVRLAPSAANSQPWRIIRIDEDFHFFVAETNYFALSKQAFLRYNDMGIALLHFELACQELGLEGKWITDKRFDNIDPALEYIKTWKTGN